MHQKYSTQCTLNRYTVDTFQFLYIVLTTNVKKTHGTIYEYSTKHKKKLTHALSVHARIHTKKY